jgi:hypothetical protein
MPTSAPQAIEVTNGEIPEDAGEDIQVNDALDLESAENVDALEQESNAASQEESAIPTAATQLAIQISPTSQPITQIPTSTSVPAAPTNRSTPTTPPTPTNKPLPTSNTLASPSPTASPVIPTATRIPTVSPTIQPTAEQAASQPQTTSGFGALNSSPISPTTSPTPLSGPTPTRQSSFSSQTIPTTNPTPTGTFIKGVSPTPQSAAPLADIAGKTYAKPNSTPTPFTKLLPYSHQPTPTPLSGVSGTLSLRTAPTSLSDTYNPLVPEAPSQSSSTNKKNWLGSIIGAIVEVVETVLAVPQKVLNTFQGTP